MTSSTNGDDGEGIRRVRQRNWRWWGLLGSGVAVCAAGILARNLYWPGGVWNDDRLNPSFAIAASIFTLLLGPLITFAYHRIIDEQEERAVLWGTAIGFYLLAFGGIAWLALAHAGLLALKSFATLLLVACLIAMAIQAWRQFR